MLTDVLEPASPVVADARRSHLSLIEAVRRTEAVQGEGLVHLEEVDLPAPVLRTLAAIVGELAEGRAVVVHTLGEDEEVTTSQAARILGMSRPTLVNLLERGEIAHRLVGTHRRVPIAAVLAYRERMERGPARSPSRTERLRGLEEMADYTDGLGLGY